MKTLILYTSLFVTLFVFNIESNAQTFVKVDVSPMDAASHPSNWRNADKLVKIIYSRPQLKGRSLDKLAPEGKVWRTGANEAPEITFYADVKFGDKEVKAGTYTLFTIPDATEWVVILSNQKNIWGSYFYSKDEDVVRVKAEVSESKKPIESFSIVFEGEGDKTTMYMGWANTIVQLPIEKL